MADRFWFKSLKDGSSMQDEAWVDWKQSLREQYPNAQREGCPGETILKRLAHGSLRLADAQVWLDHLGHCSPCFCDFERLKAKAARGRQLRAAYSAAAILLVGVSITLWVKFGHAPRSEPGAYGGQSTQGLTVTENSPSPLPTAVLHFENLSTSRGEDSESSPLPTLPRSQVALSIYLPSSDGVGKYQVEFVKGPTDPISLLRLNGNAIIENGLPVLRFRADLSGLPPGTYIARYRHIGGGWRYAQVVVS